VGIIGSAILVKSLDIDKTGIHVEPRGVFSVFMSILAKYNELAVCVCTGLMW
jgi:hypothetical protein